jgi:hypothetical protein|tara:strand:+ start:884 stop:1291 length:408 start_codon:yes stop_codon:yes gene_type:complete
MALIVKGEQNVISKEEMKKLVDSMKKGEDPLAKLSPEKREIRKEVQDAKRHREFMNRVAKNNEKELDDAIATSEIVTIATGETVQTVEQTTELPEVDFESMTKKQIDEWAEENLGIQLDRRHTKAKLIAEVKENL